MATAAQIKALLQSYAADDDARFLSVAMQIAAGAARSGRERLAAELNDLVDEVKRRRAGSEAEVRLAEAVPIVRPAGDLAGLVAASYPEVRLSDMVLSPGTRAQLDRVVREYRQAALLHAHGLCPRRKLLLVGPPGSGKTMTASAMAGELGLPLLHVQLHSLITKFMGETAAKLHLVFEAMGRTRGVYLFDEFDAIGATRTADNDVGEVRRVLNSFLQFLEQDGSDSLVVAATNLYGLLDSALPRRFDDVVHYHLPDAAMARQLVKNRLSLFDIRGLRWTKVLEAAHGLSQAEIARGCDDAAKAAVLAHGTKITAADLVHALRERQESQDRYQPEQGRRTGDARPTPSEV
ncbi:MAG: ATP-binding protein [Armatimonadetes bacterium]|nr:ATP-binding protein [Armatimonadota bacterium]